MDWFDEQVQDQPVPKDIGKDLNKIFQLEGLACDGTEGRGLWTTEGNSFRAEIQASVALSVLSVKGFTIFLVPPNKRYHPLHLLHSTFLSDPSPIIGYACH